MIAIFTRYHGPTNYRGSRYSARTADGRRVTLSADYSRDADDNHASAAAALVRKLDLAPAVIERFGETPDKRGYVFAITSRVVEGGIIVKPAYRLNVPRIGGES